MSFRDTSELHTWGDGKAEDDENALRLRYPRWSVWRGMSEDHTPTHWYATRACQPTLTADQNRDGLCCTLTAETAEELKQRLQEQEELIAQLGEASLAAS